MTASVRTPRGLGAGGRALWSAITEAHELDAVQQVQLLEACRAKDRCDKLDEVLRGDAELWMRLTHRTQTEDYELVVDKAFDKATQAATQLKQLLAALRLPDEASGRRPQHRGPRGAQRPSVPSGTPGKVSSLDRARARHA